MHTQIAVYLGIVTVMHAFACVLFREPAHKPEFVTIDLWT